MSSGWRPIGFEVEGRAGSSAWKRGDRMLSFRVAGCVPGSVSHDELVSPADGNFRVIKFLLYFRARNDLYVNLNVCVWRNVSNELQFLLV